MENLRHWRKASLMREIPGGQTRVGDHDPGESFRLSRQEPQPDQSSPILADQGDRFRSDPVPARPPSTPRVGCRCSRCGEPVCPNDRTRSGPGLRPGTRPQEKWGSFYGRGMTRTALHASSEPGVISGAFINIVDSQTAAFSIRNFGVFRLKRKIRQLLKSLVRCSQDFHEEYPSLTWSVRAFVAITISSITLGEPHYERDLLRICLSFHRAPNPTSLSV